MLEKGVFCTISTKRLEQVAAILNTRNQRSASCNVKGVDAESGDEAIEWDDEVAADDVANEWDEEIDGEDEVGVGDDEVVKLCRTV